MKIAILCHSIFDDGGVQRVITTLSNLISKENEVEVICTNTNIPIDYEKYKLDSNRVRVVYNKLNTDNYVKIFIRKIFRGLNKFTSIFNNKKSIDIIGNLYYPKNMRENFIKLCKANEYDIVIGCQGEYSVFLGIMKSKIKCKVIGWEHNSFDAYLNSKYRYYWNRDILFKEYLPYLDEHIVLTKLDANKYINQLEVSSKEIYNPLSFKSFEKSKLISKKIIAVGRLTKQKGFDNLLKAFEIVNLHNNEWTLDIVGEGEDEKKLKNLIVNLNLTKKVKIHKFTNKVEDLIREASIYSMSSRWEGFGLVVTEALELGVPVVTFNTTGPSEIIEDGKCGCIVENNNIEAFADALIMLVDSYDKRLEYSINGIERVKCFYGENIIIQWQNCFENVMKL
ncbi:MAG: glycosyltransferase family 4 protein [Clostridium sp.]|uniref:glycosyltransferase family 4 protein n=1 Tax=Clostridium sp. TaxID=1506 RepID=UPI003D6CE2A8